MAWSKQMVRMAWVPAGLLVLSGCFPNHQQVNLARQMAKVESPPPAYSAEASLARLKSSTQPTPTHLPNRDDLRYRGQFPELTPEQQQKVSRVDYDAPLKPPEAKPWLNNFKIAAWVNGKPIFVSDLNNLLQAKLAAENLDRLAPSAAERERKKILEEVLRQVIDQEVVVQDAYSKLSINPQILKKVKQAAEKQFQKRLRVMLAEFQQRTNGASEAKFKQVLARQGVSYKSLRRDAERAFIFREYLLNRAGGFLNKVGYQEIKEYYDNHAAEFRIEEKIEWKDIFIAVGPKHPTLKSAEQFAERLIIAVRAGAPFDNFLKYDDGVAHIQGGKGTGTRPGEIKPREVEPYLLRMRPGEVGPPVSISTGVHIFQLVSRTRGGVQPFDVTVQEKIRSLLKHEIYKRERERIIRELVSEAVIEVNPKVFE